MSVRFMSPHGRRRDTIGHEIDRNQVGELAQKMATIAETPDETPDETPAKTNRRTRWIIATAGAAVGIGIGVAVALSKNAKNNCDDGEEGWSKEGADWFNNLAWEDALYLLTRQEDDIPDEEDEQRLGRLKESYEKATGHRIWRECGYLADDDEDPTVYRDVGLCESCFAEVEAEFADLDEPYDPFDEHDANVAAGSPYDDDE
jgi:hypothetical protein